MAKGKHLSQSVQKEEILGRIHKKLIFLYGRGKGDHAFEKIVSLLLDFKVRKKRKRVSERDVVLITYGDSITGSKKPLIILDKFLNKYLKGIVNTVHILPFFTYSSARGFSIIDYRRINPQLGDWNNITKIHKSFSLIFDEVVNHVSSHGTWFKKFLRSNSKYDDYFISFKSEDAISRNDLSKITRPRSLPLLTKFKTA